jgi:hypothetical protein
MGRPRIPKFCPPPPEAERNARAVDRLSPPVKNTLAWIEKQSGFRPAEIIGRFRKPIANYWRDVAVWILRESGMTFNAIAATLDRDHTSVGDSYARTEKRLTDPYLSSNAKNFPLLKIMERLDHDRAVEIAKGITL